MTFLLYTILILISIFTFTAGVASLIAIKKRKIANGMTYGIGANEHMLRTGIFIEHGMVIKDGKLQAQSKNLLMR